MASIQERLAESLKELQKLAGLADKSVADLSE
jgi:hypothetical protein